MTLVVTHSTVTGAPADSTALVDGPKWDANHTVSGTLEDNQVPALHLVTYTVAPAGASTNDKARADYVGDGTNDQVAVNAAVAAARANSSYSKVVMLPGRYTFSAAANLGGAPGENGFVFEARGTFVNGPGVSGVATALDTFTISNSNFSEFNFGSIKTNNTGTAAAIHSTGNYSETKITWQALDGTARGGYGFFADTTSAATSQSVNWIEATHVQNFNRGIVLIATGASANIDTYRSTIDYIYNNNIGVYVEGNLAGSNQVNSSVWNVNIDASHTAGDIGFQTNAHYDVINATIGPVTGTQRNIVLASGATSNILNLSPHNLAVTSGSIEDNSGNTTNSVNIGMPTAFLATADARNSIAKWNGSVRGQIDYTGISFGTPIGTSQKQLYFSSAGVIGESKVAVTQPATGSTLTVDEGKTLRASNSLTLAGTDGTTMTFPVASGAVLTANSTATLTNKTFDTAGAGNSFSINSVAVTANTGTGAVVRETSPTLVTPALGTPASGVATNLTGTAAGLTAGNVTTNANLTGPITSVGNATSIASQTGTGTKFVVDTSPTLVTPTLGVASATSINKVTITTPATSSTLTVDDGKTLRAANSLVFAGTDGTTMTFPVTSATVARTDAANSFTGAQTFNTASGHSIGGASPGLGWGIYHVGTINATSGYAINWQTDAALTAAANNDILQGLRITAQPNKNGKTGVLSYGAYIQAGGPFGVYDFGIKVDDASPVYFGGNLTIKPSASVTPANNGDVTFEATSNTSLTIKHKGSDGTVRSVVLTLA